MQISQNSEPFTKYSLNTEKKTLDISFRGNHVHVDISHADYKDYTVHMRNYGILSTSTGCTIDVGYNCVVIAKQRCIITAGLKSNITTGDNAQITARNNCYIKIGSRCSVNVLDKCVIYMNEYFNYYENKFILGDNNILILDKFDNIKKNTFTKYGKGNVIIGCEDGTRLLMDESFKNLLKMCD